MSSSRVEAIGQQPGSYSVSAGIMAGYSAIDVSLQPNDGDPAHSQTSDLRAYL